MENKKPDNHYLPIARQDSCNDKALDICHELQKIITYSRDVIEGLHPNVIIYSVDGRIQMMSENIQLVSGLKEEDAVGKLPQEIIKINNPENSDILLQMDDVLSGGECKELESEYVVKSTGQAIYVRKIVTLLKCTKGKVVGLMGAFTDITDLKRKEKEESENKFLLDESQERAGIGSYNTDLIAGIFYTSQQLDKIFGINDSYPKDIQGWLDLVHPDDKEMMERYLKEEIIGKGHKFDKKYRIIRKNDIETRWVHGEGEVEHDKQGTVIALKGTIQDITDWKNIEEELKDTNELLTLFLKHSPIFTSIKEITSESKIIMLSNNYKKSLKGGVNFAIGKNLSEIFEPKLAEKFTKEDIEVVQKGEVVTIEEKYKGRTYLIIKFPIIQSNRTLLGCYYIDITKSKETEANLRFTTELLLSIINGIADPIYTKDLDGKYILVNKAFEEFVGLPEKDILGKKITEILPLGEDHPVLEKDRDVIKYEESIEGEYEVLNGEGEKRLTNIMKGPMFGSDGNLIGIYGVSHDITEQKIMAEQLRIRQTMDAVGTMAGGIAHDINNYLSGVIGFLDLALLGGNSSEDILKYIKLSISAGKKITKLIQELQKLSRDYVPEKVDFDIYDVVHELFDGIGKTIDKLVTLEIDFGVGIYSINGSKLGINQVLLNLLTNSNLSMMERGYKEGDLIKICAKNYISGEGDILSLTPGNYVHITFQDSGEGMPKSILNKAFDPYISTRKDNGTGSGLGLANVYNIVIKEHKGHVHIESEEGVGTTVHLYLPKATGEDSISVEEKKNVIGGNETILLIEDDETAQKAAKTILEKFGYKVFIAGNGKEGLEMYKGMIEKPDLLVLDLSMPEMSGQTVYEEVLKIDKDVKIVVSSGQDSEETRPKFLKAKGFADKPYDLETFLGTIRDVLDEDKEKK